MSLCCAASASRRLPAVRREAFAIIGNRKPQRALAYSLGGVQQRLVNVLSGKAAAGYLADVPQPPKAMRR